MCDMCDSSCDIGHASRGLPIPTANLAVDSAQPGYLGDAGLANILTQSADIHLAEGAGNADTHSGVDHVRETVASNEKEGVGKEERQRSKKIAKMFSSRTYRTQKAKRRGQRL